MQFPGEKVKNKKGTCVGDYPRKELTLHIKNYSKQAVQTESAKLPVDFCIQFRSLARPWFSC
jgi:hypothetical protein